MAKNGGAVSFGGLVVEQIRMVRRSRRLTVAGLANRCKKLGAGGLSIHILRHIEAGHREISATELMVVALALDVPPLLLMSSAGSPWQPLRLTSRVRVDSGDMRAWIVGERPLSVTDANRYRRAGELMGSGDKEWAWLADVDVRSTALFGDDPDRAKELSQGARSAVSALKSAAVAGGASDRDLSVLTYLEKQLGIADTGAESSLDTATTPGDPAS